eukprot:scaffold15108_cov180-Amphora_coffeaeformis.AAC.20
MQVQMVQCEWVWSDEEREQKIRAMYIRWMRFGNKPTQQRELGRSHPGRSVGGSKRTDGCVSYDRPCFARDARFDRNGPQKNL